MQPAYFLFAARARSPFWQELLCQSVRLYMVLGEPGVSATETDAMLRSVEGQMVWHLLQDQELTPEADAEAWALVEAAQARMLDSGPDLDDCLRHFSVSQCLYLVKSPAQD